MMAVFTTYEVIRQVAMLALFAGLAVLGACASVERVNSISMQSEMAQQFLASGNPAAAERILLNIVSDNPEGVRSMIALGNIYLDRGVYDKALVWFTKANRQVESGEATSGIARVHLRRNRPDKAKPLLVKALELEPGNEKIRNIYAVCLDLFGHHALAQRQYELVLEQNPGNREAASNLALSLAFSGQFSKSITVMRELARLDGQDVATRHNLALLLAMSGDRREASRVWSLDLNKSEVINNIKFISKWGRG